MVRLLDPPKDNDGGSLPKRGADAKKNGLSTALKAAESDAPCLLQHTTPRGWLDPGVVLRKAVFFHKQIAGIRTGGDGRKSE